MNAATAVPMIQTITQSNIQMNECKFFHYAPNSDKFYHITCQIILRGSDSFDDHNCDHGFLYDLNPTANYYITCKIFPHSSIVDILNKICEIETAVNNLERKELLSLNQKLDLEQSLKQILPFHLTQPDVPSREIRMNSDRNLNSSYGHNTQSISITDSQTNFGNSFPQQFRVGYSTNNVIINPQHEVFNNISQQIPEGLRYNNGNTNPFCGNTGNNAMTTQALSISDSQNNGFPQPINPLSSAASQYYVTNSQQQIDLNNTPRYITDREMRMNYYRNTNSFHENIMNNTLETHSVLTTDINQNYSNNSQYVNGIRNFAYLQQQADLNNHNYEDTGSHNGNVDVMAMQANGLTYDHQDINDNCQVNHTNNNYGDTDSHNGNIGNNVATQTSGLICDHQDINSIHQQSSPSYSTSTMGPF